jgi:hypothetical protein
MRDGGRESKNSCVAVGLVNKLAKELARLVVGRGTRVKGGSGKINVGFAFTARLLPHQWLMTRKPGVSMLMAF